MLKPGGYATIIDPGARQLVTEHDTITCPHCGKVEMTKAGFGSPEVLVFRADGSHYTKSAGFCRKCFHHVCPMCDGKDCDSRFRRIDEQESAARKLICI